MPLLERIQKMLMEIAQMHPLPSEGKERVLRDRIAQLLRNNLGWQPQQLTCGERFDIVLRDQDAFPIIYIETKDPRYSIRDDDADKALERASEIATLQCVVLTNGDEWRRYKLPEKSLEQRLRISEKPSAKEIEAFFAPLRARAHQIVSEPTRMIDVSSDVGICELANVLHKCVEALSSPLQELLELLICDGPAGRFAYHALCDWQVTSQRCTMDDMERELHSVLETMRSVKGAHEREVMLENSARKLARLTDISEEECRQRLVELLSQDEAELKLRIVVYQLAKARGDEKLFCDQTAHVLIGRLLLYRVMEDKGIVQRAISGEPLKRELKASAVQEHPLFTPPRRFIHIYQQAREHVAELSPAIYRLSVYDWWLVWDVNVEGMQRERRVRMRRIQGQMDCTLCNVLRMLNRFDFRDVNGDVWRDVYQRYLPSEERLRLGGFYTPPQLVRMVLKLAGYDGSGKLLDPACGSGTFLVEAMRMARECEERRMKGTRKARRMQIILKRLGERMRGIDIHPFATILTHINLLFQTIDLLQAVGYEAYVQVPLWALESDYLERSGERVVQYRLEDESLHEANARAREAVKRWREAERVKDEKFEFIVGNPPWGGVLRRGRPLEAKAQYYRSKYKSARGKYDVYVLFMERGIEQLDEGGTLAFVTQNRYLSKDYGAALRSIIVGLDKQKCSVDIIVDMGEIGGTMFFPEQTNYPCVTILRKGTLKHARLIRVIGGRGWQAEAPEDSTERLIKTILDVATELKRKKYMRAQAFKSVMVEGVRVKQEVLREWSRKGHPWDLTMKEMRIPKPFMRVGDAFDVFQGATPGGAGVARMQQIVLLDARKAQQLQIERKVLRKALRGRHVKRGAITWDETYALYPYDDAGNRINLGDGIWEADAQRAMERIKEAIAVGRVKARNASLYLLNFYTQLSQRIFAGKSLREHGREWYDWWNPRDPKRVCASLKIVTPRITHETRFALDMDGFLILDSCIGLLPKRESDAWKTLVDYVSKAIGRQASEREVLQYVVAVLNADFNDELLKLGGTPSRGGYYIIGEPEVTRLVIPLRRGERYKELVHALADGKALDVTPLFSSS